MHSKYRRIWKLPWWKWNLGEKTGVTAFIIKLILCVTTMFILCSYCFFYLWKFSISCLTALEVIKFCNVFVNTYLFGSHFYTIQAQFTLFKQPYRGSWKLSKSFINFKKDLNNWLNLGRDWIQPNQNPGIFKSCQF